MKTFFSSTSVINASVSTAKENQHIHFFGGCSVPVNGCANEIHIFFLRRPKHVLKEKRKN